MYNNPVRKHARKAVMCGAAAAMVLTMVPASAFAAADLDPETGLPVYKLPTEPMAIQQTATDGAGNTYTVDTLSVCAAQPPMQMPYYSLLGINNTMAGRASASKPSGSAQNGLFGSDANVSPDPYLYNYCASLNGATVAADAMINASANMTVTIAGTEYNMPCDVYMETTMIQSTADTKSGDYTYARWVALENQRENRTKTTTYNPTFIKLSLQDGGTYKLTESLYAIAEQADSIIAGSKDENGNYTYNTRYAEGTETWKVAANYEDIIKGSQYYLLSQLADGTIAEKATVAVICGYDENTGNYAVRKLDIGDGDVDSNSYGGRIASAVCTIANDMNDLGLEPQQEAYVGTTSNFGQTTTLDESEYVAWYSAEQIVENCDAVLITDAYQGNAQRYLAHASDGTQPTVYTNTANLTTAQAAAKAAGKDAADICVNWPQSLFGCYYAQGCENVMLTLVSECFLYPETFDLTDMMAWWAKNVWHITDASLQDMVDSTCYNVSLSENQSKIGTISDDFEATIDAMIDKGNQYYLENTEAIDALNEGNIKTHSINYLKARTPGYVGVTVDCPTVGKGEKATVTATLSTDDTATYRFCYSVDGGTTWTQAAKNTTGVVSVTANATNTSRKWKVIATTADGQTAEQSFTLSMTSPTVVASATTASTYGAKSTVTVNVAGYGIYGPAKYKYYYSTDGTNWTQAAYHNRAYWDTDTLQVTGNGTNANRQWKVIVTFKDGRTVEAPFAITYNK